MRNIFFIILMIFSVSSRNCSGFDAVSELLSIYAWIPKKTIACIGITVGILYVFRYNILSFIDRKAKEKFKPKPISSDEMISILQKSSYAPSVISRLRNQGLTKQDKQKLDQKLISHYKKAICEALSHIEPSKRQIWFEEATDLLIFNKNTILGKYGELSRENSDYRCAISDGSERAQTGTKYEALTQVKDETKQFSTLEYVQNSEYRYKTPAEVLFIDC